MLGDPALDVGQDMVDGAAGAPVGDLVLTGGGKATRPASTAAADLAAARRPRPLSPRQAACVEIAMGVTMGYMLILML